MPSTRQQIEKWHNRQHMSEQEMRWRTEVRLRARSWFLNRFHSNKGAIHTMDMEQREVNVTWAFIRSLQTSLWNSDPIPVIASPYWTPNTRRTMALALENQMKVMAMGDEMNKVIQDIGLGGFGVLRTGFDNPLAWSEKQYEREIVGARKEALAILDGQDPAVSVAQDHDARIEELLKIRKQWAEGGVDGQDIEKLEGLIDLHRERQDKQPRPPMVLDNPAGAWVRRVPMLSGQKAAFGWEIETPFRDARYLWMRSIQSIDEVRNNPYYNRKTRMAVQPTAARRNVLRHAAPLGPNSGGATNLDGDIKLIETIDMLDRHTNKWLTFAPGQAQHGWLHNERYGFADLFRGTGFEMYMIAEDTETGFGLTPIESAASQIITMNKTEHLFAKAAAKSVPGMVGNRRAVDPTDQRRISNLKAGEIVWIDNREPGTKMSDHFVNAPEPKAADIIQQVKAQAEAQLNVILGFSEARMGGGESSRSATAANVVQSSTTEFIGAWNRRIEVSTNRTLSNILQIDKARYSKNEMVMLVGPEKLEFWPDFDNPEIRHFLFQPEIVEVETGSALPGNRANQMRKASEFVGQMVQFPGSNIPELQKLLCRVYGYAADRYVMEPEVQADLAAQQPETGAEVPVGGPDQGAPPAPDSGGQSASDIVNQNRQNAAQLGRAAGAGG